MKKFILFLFVCVGFRYNYAQQVEVSSKYNIQLVFSMPIIQKTLGDDQLFAFGKEEEQDPRILSLRFFGDSNDNAESNVQVVTAEGNMYDIKLVNKEEPFKRTYVVDPTEKIHQLTGHQNRSNRLYSSYSQSHTSLPSYNNPYGIAGQNEFYGQQLMQQRAPVQQVQMNQSRSEYAVNKNDVSRFFEPTNTGIFNDRNRIVSMDYGGDKETFIRNKSRKFKVREPEYFLPRHKYVKRQYNMKLRLNGVYVSNNELYLAFEIKNNSGNPYEIADLQLYVDSAPGSKYKVDQPLSLAAVNISGLSRVIEAHSSTSIVYVVNKLTLNEHKILRLQIDELNGERHLDLNVSHKSINNPLRG